MILRNINGLHLRIICHCVENFKKSFGLLLFPSLTGLLFVESNKHEDWVQKNPELIQVAQ